MVIVSHTRRQTSWCSAVKAKTHSHTAKRYSYCASTHQINTRCPEESWVEEGNTVQIPKVTVLDIGSRSKAPPLCLVAAALSFAEKILVPEDLPGCTRHIVRVRGESAFLPVHNQPNHRGWPPRPHSNRTRCGRPGLKRHVHIVAAPHGCGSRSLGCVRPATETPVRARSLEVTTESSCTRSEIVSKVPNQRADDS